MKKWIIATAAIGAISLALGVQLGHSDENTARLVTPQAALVPPLGGYQKVLVIVEENKTYERVIGNRQAPYLTELARTYGQASAMDAGYPTECPSLAAYIIMTSGRDHGICDGDDPSAHPLPGASVFSQVTAAGKQWRMYAEDMPSNCAPTDRHLFAVRHVPSNYYVDLRSECTARSVPMGTLESGAFHDDLATGTLPELGFAIPNLCNDMHSAKACPEAVPIGDDWLRKTIPAIQAGADYRAGRLVVLIAFDEGNKKSNHIPFVAISPTTAGIDVTRPASLCSILATMSQLLAVEPLGCAANATSLAADLRLIGLPVGAL